MVPADGLFPPPPLPPPSISSSYSYSYCPSLLIITALIAAVSAASAAIHLLLRRLSLPPPPPLISQPSDRDRTAALIDTLPLFSLAPRSSPECCAVCLSRLRASDELRLVPSCRHAFHSPCIATWLLSTPSCPLCRSPILLPPPQPIAHVADLAGEKQEEDSSGATAGPPEAPGEEVAAAVGEEERGWLRDCVDRISTSASSSFSSLRFSSRRFDSGAGESWDSESEGAFP